MTKLESAVIEWLEAREAFMTSKTEEPVDDSDPTLKRLADAVEALAVAARELRAALDEGL